MRYHFRSGLVPLVAFGVIVFGATFAVAQGIVTGSISGVVQDPQGAVVAGAHVSAKHLATNREFKAQTNSAGVVELRDLPTGAYEMCIRDSFVLNQVQDAAREGADPDKDKKVSQYLCALTEPHDGLAYDYDQIRVFTWNVRKHRYETAYREHALNGVLPVTVTSENFDKEGTLPVFILRVKDDSGNVSQRKYKLNTPIVRRVLAPGEQKTAPKPAKKQRRH